MYYGRLELWEYVHDLKRGQDASEWDDNLVTVPFSQFLAASSKALLNGTLRPHL